MSVETVCNRKSALDSDWVEAWNESHMVPLQAVFAAFVKCGRTDLGFIPQVSGSYHVVGTRQAVDAILSELEKELQVSADGWRYQTRRVGAPRAAQQPSHEESLA